MGNGPLAAINDKSKRKTLVIVGFSYAGFTIAQQVWDYYNVTVVDQNQYFEHLCANIKTTVDPEFVDRVLHPYDKMVQAYPKLTFLQAKLKQVTNSNMIVVEKDGADIKVNFDVLVLCTGFSYDQPVKGEASLTLADRK